jgi:type III restriction enzyme
MRNGAMMNSNEKYINNRLALRPPQAESLSRFVKICDAMDFSKFIGIKTAFRQAWAEIDKEADALDFGADKATLKERQDKLVASLAETYKPLCAEELTKVNALFPTLSDFERDFPSVCFALATGIGKTRLMGALIAYLVYEKDIKNFFVMAPNLTIYKKLKADLGSCDNPKYVFRGLDRFVTPPRIIDGDNYADFRSHDFISSDVTINIFNISKLNSESGRMRRLSEVLGQSYFEYLRSLTDLCIFMDESHHYHADRGFETINDLHPILGVELTATPQMQSGSRRIDFKNVVYEYSLASALNDGLYVKVPVVFTRKDFHADEYAPEQLDREKLIDGIRIHEETKSKLEIYANEYEKSLVKPFVLVVARDTEHSRQITEYLTSQDFFGGEYKDKVLEINSAQRGAERDENIERLLMLEKPENRIEIVIHVNMLKEGWDVTNLYTIIPLRASASETLTEQTIGRGLRLPYGQRTSVEEIDRLSIVSHDRYEAIVALANDPNSLVRRISYIDDIEQADDGQRETIAMPTIYDEYTTNADFTQQLACVFNEANPEYVCRNAQSQVNQITQFIAERTAKTVSNLGGQIKSFDAVNDIETKQAVRNNIANETIEHFPNAGLNKTILSAVVERAVNTCTQLLTDNVIPIPVAVVQPFTEATRGFRDFKLDTCSLNWHPSDDSLVGTELHESGKTFEYAIGNTSASATGTVESEVASHIIERDNVDYSQTSDLIFSLIGDAKAHFNSYLSTDDAEKVMRTRQKSLAEFIYKQMNEHSYQEETGYRTTNMRPFTRLETGFGSKFKSDNLYDLEAAMTDAEVKTRVFTGFEKACHTRYKFANNTERTFARVLERDGAVLKWLRPAARQFDIKYGADGASQYIPDFVVETAEMIYLCETKSADEVQKSLVMKSGDIWEKAIAAIEYCRAATKWNQMNGGKSWRYVLISHDEVRLNASFEVLAKNSVPLERLVLDA